MVKRGMPLTSESDAQRWRLANQTRVSTARSILPKSLPSSEPKKELDASSFRLVNSLGRLERSKKIEVAAYDLVVKAKNAENPVAMRSAINGWGEAKKRVSEAEMEHARYEETTRQTIRMDEVREFITTWFGAIRNLMDAMPSSLSARANPSDPECAKVAIQEGVDQIFITIQKAEGEFK